MKKTKITYDLIYKKKIPADTQGTTLNIILLIIKWTSLSFLPYYLLKTIYIFSGPRIREGITQSMCSSSSRQSSRKLLEHSRPEEEPQLAIRRGYKRGSAHAWT